METRPHQLLGLGQIAITVGDVERAARFYQDVLGIPFLFSAPPGLAFLQIGETRLMLTKPENGEPIANSVLYLKVSDIEASYQALSGQAEFLDQPHLIAKMPDHELWMTFLKDSEGNTVGLMEERREKNVP